MPDEGAFAPDQWTASKPQRKDNSSHKSRSSTPRRGCVLASFIEVFIVSP